MTKACSSAIHGCTQQATYLFYLNIIAILLLYCCTRSSAFNTSVCVYNIIIMAKLSVYYKKRAVQCHVSNTGKFTILWV